MDGGVKRKSYKQYLEIEIARCRNCRVDRPGLDQRNVSKAWKRGVFGLHAGQCVCGLKMNKLMGRTSHRLGT